MGLGFHLPKITLKVVSFLLPFFRVREFLYCWQVHSHHNQHQTAAKILSARNGEVQFPSMPLLNWPEGSLPSFFPYRRVTVPMQGTSRETYNGTKDSQAINPHRKWTGVGESKSSLCLRKSPQFWFALIPQLPGDSFLPLVCAGNSLLK